MDTTNLAFYYNYIDQCNKKGLSPSAAAEAMGIKRSSVTQWGHGRQPRRATLQKLADFFGCTVEELTKDEQKENTRQQDADGLTDAQCELMNLIPTMTPMEVSVLLATAKAQEAARKPQDGLLPSE